jgi:hypothetical protein
MEIPLKSIHLEDKSDFFNVFSISGISIDLKKVCDCVRREVLYSILIECDMPMELVRLIKMCLNETCCEVHIAKHLSDMFSIPNALKQGDALSPLLSKFTLEYVIRKVQEYQVGLKLNGTHQFLVTGHGGP